MQQSQMLVLYLSSDRSALPLLEQVPLPFELFLSSFNSPSVLDHRHSIVVDKYYVFH